MKKLDTILLIDDDEDSNFFHTRLIKKMDCAEQVKAALNGKEGLEILKGDRDYRISLILLDINMPVMNGWEFLEVYNQLETKHKSEVIVVMLTSSVNPDDRKKAESMGIVADFIQKYLTQEKLEEILGKYFPDQS